MLHVLPHNGLVAMLWGTIQSGGWGGSENTAHHTDPFIFRKGVTTPNLFDVNTEVVKDPLVAIKNGSTGDWAGTGDQRSA